MKAGARSFVPMLAAALILAAAVSPAPAVEDHFEGTGRGDVHSKGWQEAMKLKGEPMEPRFPQVGKGIERHVLDNGLVIYLAEDHSLPLIRMELLFRGGAAWESPEEYGVSRLTGSQMRGGGTQALTPEDLDDRLGFLAANISTFIGDEWGSASLDVLRAKFDEALPLFADVVLRPRFDESRLQIAKKRRIFRLMHRNDNPGQILSREFATLLYGPDHPSGRQLTPMQVQKIGRDDLVAAHERFVRPNQAWLAVVGAFDGAEMLGRLKKSFGGWERGAGLEGDLPRAEAKPKPGVYLIDRPVNQSSIAVGHLGVDRTEPDRYAIDLMNVVLGGGSFSSRITERVRSDEGLAYSARTRYETSGRDLGTFQATVQTKSASTGRAIELILEEIEKIRRPGSLSRNEFATASESRLYSFVFRFDNLADNVVRLMRNEMEGLPADQARRDFKGYQAVKPAEVEAAARKHLRPDDLTIFVVGNAAEVTALLGEFGEVRLIELEEFEMGGPGRGMRRGGPGRGSSLEDLPAE